MQDHKQWIKDNNIHQELQDEENKFNYRLLKSIQPRSILVLGGYQNLDLFYALQGVKEDCYVINVDLCTPDSRRSDIIIYPDLSEFHDKLKEHFNFKGTYIHIKEEVNLEKAMNRQWDIIWDNCFIFAKPSLFKDQTVVSYHLGRPTTIFNKLSLIDKHTKIQAMSRNLAYFGNIKEHINQALGYNGYETKVNNQYNNTNHQIFWPYYKQRIIPYTTKLYPDSFYPY